MAPKQQRFKSKQTYGTPLELLTAVKKRLQIQDFSIDLAASYENAVTSKFLTENDNALRSGIGWNPYPNQWAWCNPPYANIELWVKKAYEESQNGANIAMLIPASVGANWWLDYVADCSYQVFLNGRITFVGCEDPYPKDCALLLYTPWGMVGNEVWSWKTWVA